jgi:hypothetical protein
MRRSLLLASLAVPLAAAARQRAVPPLPTGIALDVVRDGERFRVTARADMQADASVAWATLTDYQRMPQFIPYINRVRVQARTPRPSGETLKVAYEGTLKLLFLSIPTLVWLDVEHVPFTDVIARLSAVPQGEAVGSLKRFTGRYTLAVVGSGTSAGSSGSAARVRLDYNAEFELAQPLPPVLGLLFGTAAVRSTLREQFGALVVEIERRSRARQGLQPSR